MQYLKKIVKASLRGCGLELSPYRPELTSNAQIAAALRHFGIDLVFDVGANKGQFASAIRNHGYAGKIVSFEPLADAYAELSKRSVDDPNWVIHPKCAIGNSIGTVDINVSRNSVSSSILPMLSLHEDAAPESKYICQETVEINTLDSIAESYLENVETPFIKIDTQGYEWEVINGAENTLKRCQGVLLELSLMPLYEGQYLWLEVIEKMKAMGLTIWSLHPGFADIPSGRTLQMDGIFFRSTHQ